MYISIRRKSKLLTNMRQGLLAGLAILVVIGVQSALVPAFSSALSSSGSTWNGSDQCQGDYTTCICPTQGADPAGGCQNDPAQTGELNGCAPGAADCNIVTKWVNPFIKVLSLVVGIGVVLGIIIGGIQYSASGGDPQKAANAKKHIRNALLALVAFFFLYAFIRFITPGGDITG